MRINYNTYPALKYLKEDNIIHLKAFEKDKETVIENKDEIMSLFLENKNDFATNITVISENFMQAAKMASEKLGELINKKVREERVVFNPKGTFIIGDFIVMFSEIYSNLGGDAKVFVFQKDGTFLSCASENHTEVRLLIESRDELLITKRVLKNSAFAIGYGILVRYCMLFKQYAEVETKILEPKKKTKIFGCKYLNETDMNITHLDSKWFTNLVKSDAFKVRGHFRLQPKKKEGKWTKELIWINDFEKSGYTAPARKLTQTQ